MSSFISALISSQSISSISRRASWRASSISFFMASQSISSISRRASWRASSISAFMDSQSISSISRRASSRASSTSAFMASQSISSISRSASSRASSASFSSSGPGFGMVSWVDCSMACMGIPANRDPFKLLFMGDGAVLKPLTVSKRTRLMANNARVRTLSRIFVFMVF